MLDSAALITLISYDIYLVMNKCTSARRVGGHQKEGQWISFRQGKGARLQKKPSSLP